MTIREEMKQIGFSDDEDKRYRNYLINETTELK